MHHVDRIVNRGSLATLCLLSGAFVVGCSATSETSGPAATDARGAAVHTTPSASINPLADTDWQLAYFQSMDDAQGTTRPDNPSLYSMRLNADGTVNMRLNCNRANGTWTAEPSADPSNGSFGFGPLAMTRALCPPPSLDELVAAQAEYVRGYLLKDGRLHLSLMADGGIFAWDRAVPYLTQPDKAIEAAILEASPDYTREIVGIAGREARYVYSRLDLNDDGRDEVLVYMLGSIFCGTGGCTLMLFTDSGDGLKLIDTFPITQDQVIVSTDRSHGWNNLIRLEAGGGAPPTYVTHVFDGVRYVEQERVPADEPPEGTWCLAGEISYDEGVPLEPRG